MPPEAPSRLDRFLTELKRRRVYRVAVVYVAVAFALLQGLDIIFPALSAPDWLMTVFVVLVLVGFPVAIALAWAFDVGPAGVERTGELGPEAQIERLSGGARAVRVGGGR